MTDHEYDDQLTDEDRIDAFLDALDVSEPESRPALRPQMEPSEAVLIALAALFVVANVALWVSTAAVIAAAALALS